MKINQIYLTMLAIEKITKTYQEEYGFKKPFDTVIFLKEIHNALTLIEKEENAPVHHIRVTYPHREFEDHAEREWIHHALKLAYVIHKYIPIVTGSDLIISGVENAMERVNIPISFYDVFGSSIAMRIDCNEELWGESDLLFNSIFASIAMYKKFYGHTSMVDIN